MAKGFPSKPNDEKTGHRKNYGQDFVLAPELPERPKGLSRLARREWEQITRMLLAKGGLAKVDGKALAAYCEAYARSEEANRLIDKFGLMVPVYFVDKVSDLPLKDAEGNFVVKEWRRNPATLIHKDYLMVQARYLDMFGLSPKSRMSLKLLPKPKENGLAALMQDKPVTGFQAGAAATPPVVRPGRQFTQPATPAVNEKPAAPSIPPANEPLKI